VNATNHQNVYIYSYDQGHPPDVLPRRHVVDSLPLLPYFGLELSF